jgi:hypothetical protein
MVNDFKGNKPGRGAIPPARFIAFFIGGVYEIF